MAKSVRETETTYDTPEGVRLPSFTGLPGVSAVSSPRGQRLDAEYYDTDDLRLLRAGVTLRRRTGGDDAGWHLKLPAGAGTRREIQLPGTLAAVPAELSDLVQARARGAPLRPVARIETARRVVSLLGESGDSLADVADDTVSAQTLGDSTTVSRWREVEVELTGGGEELLQEAGRALRHAGLRPAAVTTKLARALDLSPGHRDGARLSRRPTAAEVVLAYLRAQCETMTAYDPPVRRDEPDAVHQMRVAARRIRGALQAFRGVLRRDATEHLQAELRWLGGELGVARDAEVLAEMVAKGIRQTPADDVIGAVAATVAEHFAATRRTGRDRVLSALRSPRYFRLLDDLDRLLADPPLTQAATRPAGDVLPADVARAYKRTARRMRRALRAPTGRSRDAALHEARKAAKRARYAGEAVTPALGKPAKRFTSRMKKTQSVLGEHQDTVIARHVTRDLGVRAHLAGENAFTYGMLHERGAQQGARLQTKAERAWRRASKRKARRWLP